MNAERTLVVIGGPTASGKTTAAAAIAKQYGTEVISGDSRQFYHAMRIGTARPGEDELLGVQHHFLGHLEIERKWSAGQFAREAEPVLQGALDRFGIAVLVGGSGLYLDALTKGLDPLPTSDMRLRERLQHRLEQHGIGGLLKELEQHDPLTFQRVDHNNPHRVIRALEVCLITGKPYSAQRSTPTDREDVRIVRIAMDVKREALYQRINARVDRMVADGLIDEVRSLLPHRELNALRTVGYRELFEHFDGRCSLVEAIALIKQHTRNFAKRQMTWLRRDGDWQWIAPEDHTAMVRAIDATRQGQT